MYSARAASRWNRDFPTPGGPWADRTRGLVGLGSARWSQMASVARRSPMSWPTSRDPAYASSREQAPGAKLTLPACMTSRP